MESEYSVTGLQDGTQMCSGVEDTITATHAIFIACSSARTRVSYDLCVGKDEFALDGAGRLDIEDDEFYQITDGCERVERLTPVERCGDIGVLKRGRVHKMERVTDSGTECQGAAEED